jgi:hypothetical protein
VHSARLPSSGFNAPAILPQLLGQLCVIGSVAFGREKLMASSNFKRLSLLLPTVLVLSHALPNQVAALELGASEWVAKILNAIAARDALGAQSATDILRRCGVESIVSNDLELSLIQIDSLIGEIRAGRKVTLPTPAGASGSAFVVSKISQVSVQCAPPPTYPALADSSGGTGGTGPSSV